jgi:hypothetical protein
VDGGVLLSASANTASIQWEAGPLGKVMLEVTNNFGCAAADTFDVGIEFVGIDEASESPLKIFPNPSNGQFSIQLEDALPEAEIRIYNTIGQVVHKQSINNKSRLDLNLDLPVGSYLISIISEGEKTNQWIVIE